MGKKKTKKANKEIDKGDPERLKDAGNEAFMGKEFGEAINYYSQAIDIAIEQNMDSSIWAYYSNRANAHL